MWVGTVDQEAPAVLTAGVLMPIACRDDLGYAGAKERMRVTASEPHCAVDRRSHERPVRGQEEQLFPIRTGRPPDEHVSLF